jgi:hypothetical protein
MTDDRWPTNRAKPDWTQVCSFPNCGRPVRWRPDVQRWEHDELDGLLAAHRAQAPTPDPRGR